MTPINIKKFFKFIVFPDFMYRFLLSNNYSIPSLNKIHIDFKYSFSTFNSFSPTAIRMLNSLESIYPKRAFSSKKIIRLSFQRKRIHSFLYLRLNGYEAFTILSYLNRKPNKLAYKLNPLTERKQIISPTFLSFFRYSVFQRVTLHHVFNHNRNFVKYLFFALYN